MIIKFDIVKKEYPDLYNCNPKDLENELLKRTTI